MQKSGGRRIKRAILIDQKSIRFLENKEILNYKKNLLLRDEINRIIKNQSSWNSRLDDKDNHPSNMRRISASSSIAMLWQVILILVRRGYKNTLKPAQAWFLFLPPVLKTISTKILK